MKNAFYYLGIIILNLNLFFYNIFIDFNYKNELRIVAIIALIVHLIINAKGIKISHRYFATIGYALLIIIFNISNTSIYNFMIFMLIIIGSICIDKNKVLKLLLKTSCFIITSTIILIRTNLITNQYYEINGRVRYKLGFQNANTFPIILYSSIMIYALYRKKLKLYEIIVINVLVILTNKLTDNRSVVLAILIFSAVYLIVNKIDKGNKVFKYLIIFTNLFAVLLSFIINNISKYLPELDIILSYRPKIFGNYIKQLKPINYVLGGGNNIEIDNGFLVILSTLGIVILVDVVYHVIKKLSYSLENNDAVTVAFLTSYMYMNFVEGILLRPEIAVSIYFWLSIIENNKLVEKED